MITDDVVNGMVFLSAENVNNRYTVTLQSLDLGKVSG